MKRVKEPVQKIVNELVSTDAPDSWKTLKDGVLKTCDEVRGKKSRRHGGCGEMRRSRIPLQERRRHSKSCACFHQKKIRLNTNV